MLALPNNQDSFILDTNASNEAIGCELLQIQDGVEKVIAYGSYALTKEQRKYCTTRKELLAIVRFRRQFRNYLLGKPFTVRTDHSSLTWLLRFKEPQGQLARWTEELSQYNMVLQHTTGRKHGNADSLSRIPCGETPCDEFVPGVRPANLSCGGCSYYVRADSQWGTFTREVDEAVPLTSPGTSSARGVVHDVKVPEGAAVMGERGCHWLVIHCWVWRRTQLSSSRIRGYQRRQWVSRRITRVNRMASQSMVAVEPVT